MNKQKYEKHLQILFQRSLNALGSAKNQNSIDKHKILLEFIRNELTNIQEGYFD